MKDKFTRLMYSIPLCDVKAAYIDRIKTENERVNEARSWLVSKGYVELSGNDQETIISVGSDEYLPDGRVVIRAQKKVWALPAEVHKKNIEQAIDAAQRNAESTPVAMEQASCPALIDGQICGGTLSATPVCPRCSLGKMGVQSVLECDVCGHKSAIMRQA